MKNFLLYLIVFLIAIPIYSQTQKIVAFDRASSDEYGRSVAVSGDYAIVGTSNEDEDAAGGNTLSRAGSAYIYKRDGSGVWNLEQKIVPSVRAVDDFFGFSVAISGTTIVVGAAKDDEDAVEANYLTGSGSAYVFDRDGSGVWVQTQKIVATIRKSGDAFGGSISISGDYIAVGATSEDEDAAEGSYKSAAGGGYIFERNGAGVWNQIQKIVANDRLAGDYFGCDVSISGDYAIFGAYREDHDAAGGGSSMSSAGSAYIFERDGSGNWSQAQKIVASDRTAYDYFGFVVSLSGSYAAVGAHDEHHDASGGANLSNAGSAYVYERDGVGVWNQVQKIVASDRNASDDFGRAIEISGDYIVVGAPSEDEDASGGNYILNTGSAYVFKRDGAGVWNESQKLVAFDRGYSDGFSYSVAIDGSTIFVGAYPEDHDEVGANTMTSAGSVYVFGPTVLPVELINFNAVCRGSSIHIEWSTQSEINNNYFVIEKSYNAVDFSELETIEGAGNSNVMNTYSFTDDELKGNTSYYRLKQVDFDGATTYFEIIASSCDVSDFNVSQFVLTENSLVFNVNASVQENLTIYFYDYRGRLISSSKKVAVKGINSIDINGFNIDAGIYLVSIVGESQKFSTKLLKR